jgi:hypothetical protein
MLAAAVSTECSGARKGVSLCAVSVRKAAVVITECSGGRRVCHPAVQLVVVIHRMLLERRVCYPCAVMQAAVVIHRMPGGRRWLSRCHASCCHDSQNVWCRRCVLSLRCHARCCCDSQNALVQERCAIPALPCMQAAVMIHRMLWWKKGWLSPAAALLLL